MNFLFTLALRYLLGRRQRTLLTTLAVTIGVMLIFGLNGMIPALMGTLRQNLMVTANQSDFEITSQARGVFDAQAAEAARGVEGVASARGVLARPLVLSGDLALPVRAGKAIDAVIVTGLEPAGLDGLLMTTGRSLLAGDQEGVVITERLAQATGLTPGDRLRLPTAGGVRAYQVVGVAAEAPALRAEPIFMPLAQAQALFDLPDQINSIEVILKPDAIREVAVDAVLARLGNGFKVGENDAGSELITAIDAGQFVFNLFGALALVMGGFIIFNTFRTIVVERRRDIGMLRAIGATRGMVLRLVLLESLLQGLAGTALGLLGGYAMINGLVRLMAPVVRELM
nr:ABC transporter permease [Anaerolinea sp.]